MPTRASNGPLRAAPGSPASARPAPSACDAVALAFEAVGGVAALAEWVEASDDNRKVFYATIFPKILALDVAGDCEPEPIHEIRRTIVRL